MIEKPAVKSITIWLGVAIAILPGVIEFVQNGRFDAASILAFILGVLVIVNRILSTPAEIRGFLK